MNIIKLEEFDGSEFSMSIVRDNLIFPCYGKDNKPLYLETGCIDVESYAFDNYAKNPLKLKLPIHHDTLNGVQLLNCLKEIDRLLEGDLKKRLIDKFGDTFKSYTYLPRVKVKKTIEKDILNDIKYSDLMKYEPLIVHFDINNKTKEIKTKLYHKNCSTNSIAKIPISDVNEFKKYIYNGVQIRYILRGDRIFVLKDKKKYGITFKVTQIEIINKDRPLSEYGFSNSVNGENKDVYYNINI
jgi:hypothetical protein